MHHPKNPKRNDPQIVNVKAVLHRLQRISAEVEAEQPGPDLHRSLTRRDAKPTVRPSSTARPAKSAPGAENHRLRVLTPTHFEPAHQPATKPTIGQVEVLDRSQDKTRGWAFAAMALAALGALIAVAWWLTQERGAI